MLQFARALVILPFISIVSEKTAHLKAVLQDSIGCTVKGYVGVGENSTPLAPRYASALVTKPHLERKTTA